MLKFQHNQGSLYRRLAVIGIPPCHISRFISEIIKWETNSGEEWTLKRLKALKVDLIRAKTGLPAITWIRKNRYGRLYGVVGSLFRWSLKNDKNFGRGIQAFMAYSFYIFGSITEDQKTKFLEGINPKCTDCTPSDILVGVRSTVKMSFSRRHVSRRPRPLLAYRASPEKKAPRFFGKKSVPQCDNILDDLQVFNTVAGCSLYSRFQRLFEPLLQGCEERKRRLEPTNRFPMPLTSCLGGEIHFIQEPGGKLRSVASPFRIFQEVLRPLGDELYDILKRVPWDCTHDQEHAMPFIQSCLLHGKRVHSVDLSSATDNFPLDLQLEVLRSIFSSDDHDHIDLFREISRGRWKSPLGELQWTKGQPLGLYPSFAAFALTHGVLLLHLAGGVYTNQFFVLGDDVVILDDILHRKYIHALDRMNCPWSPSKSISSNVLSEFAGKIMSSTQVIPQLKWRGISDDSFLDICRLLGPRSRSLLTRRQKRVFDQVRHLCAPIGLNHSLPGDNLSKMVSRTLDFYRPEVKILGCLMGLSKTIHRNVYSSVEPIDLEKTRLIAQTFDEKVKSVFQKIILSRWEVAQSIGLDAFSGIPAALGLDPRLPWEENLPSRVTTLLRYERMLQIQH